MYILHPRFFLLPFLLEDVLLPAAVDGDLGLVTSEPGPVVLVSFSALEDGRDQGGPAAAPVLREHEVELVVDAHELADPGLHHVLEVGVVAEQGAVNGDHHVPGRRRRGRIET